MLVKKSKSWREVAYIGGEKIRVEKRGRVAGRGLAVAAVKKEGMGCAFSHGRS